MTQEQLAEWVNVSDDTIKRIESGKGAKSDIAFAIAETLKVPIELLFPPQQNISTEYESRDSLSILKNIESLIQKNTE